jgi:hypothetical protein
MEKTLDIKLGALKEDPACRAFILADAKDADMAFGISSPGKTFDGRLRSLSEFRDQIREIVSQGLVDIMLMSASTSEVLTIRERIFASSAVTPVVRANDTTDVHIIRGARYSVAPSRPLPRLRSSTYRPANVRTPRMSAAWGPILDSIRSLSTMT